MAKRRAAGQKAIDTGAASTQAETTQATGGTDTPGANEVHRRLQASRVLQRRLKTEFDAAHQRATAGFRNRDFETMGKAFAQERRIIERQVRLIDEHLAATRRPKTR